MLSILTRLKFRCLVNSLDERSKVEGIIVSKIIVDDKTLSLAC